MEFNKIGGVSKVLALAAALGISLGAAAEARTLKVQTSSTASHFTLAFLNEHWVPRLKEMTGGSLEIELLPIKAVVPHREIPEAVAMGILDGDLTSINYFAGRDPSFALMGDLIAGYDSADQIQACCANGGGKEMLQKMYDKFQPGVHVIGCGAYAREAFVSQSAWDKMTPAERAALETWYVAAYNHMRRVVDMVDRELVARDRAAGDITVIDWPEAERDKFREIAVGAWKDYAGSSEMAGEVYAAHIAFMKQISLLKPNF